MADHPPARLLLDTSVIQVLERFGESIYDGGGEDDEARLAKWSGGAAQVEALRLIMQVGQRLAFQFCVSDAVLREVDAGSSASRWNWALELREHWHLTTAHENVVLDEAAAVKLESRRFGFLSAADRRVVQDALRHRCPIVLTLDARLVRGCRGRLEELGVEVLLPTEYWERLRPWAALYV